MIEVDGAQRSGSGTIVRYAVAFSGLLGIPVRVRNARALRPKPGLRPQHVAAIRAAAELCGARATNLRVNATEFTFEPAGPPRGGTFDWRIGTAGSTTMLALGLLPLAAFARERVRARVTGGLFQDFAPSPHHLAQVLAPLLERMGLRFRLGIERPGYVPSGEGVLTLEVDPLEGPLRPLRLEERGQVARVDGVALSSHLEERGVSERMAAACGAKLARAGLEPSIERAHDAQATQPGASLAVWAHAPGGAVLGADAAGAIGRSSEWIGRSVAGALLADLATGATVDTHAADMLVLFAALAAGETRYVAPRVTEHVETNLWLVERFGARATREGTRIRIEGIGFAPRP